MSKEKIKPQRVDEKMILKEVEKEEKKRLTSLKGISEFGKKSFLLVLLLSSLIVIGTIYDAVFSATSMIENTPILGYIYTVLLFSFIALLGYIIVKQFMGYFKLKRINTLQSQGLELLKNPTNNIKSYVSKVIEHYKEHQNPDIVKKANKLEFELGTLMNEEVLDRLDELLLKPLDKTAKDIIVNYSTQTAISTAISPVAFIDAILIISRSHAMIVEVSNLYGYKPNFIGEVLLVKSVFINLAFASVTELLTHHSGDIFGTSMISKISLHSAQGIANGVLIARVGLGTIRSVRPFVYKEKNEGFLRNITKTIISKVFNK